MILKLTFAVLNATFLQSGRMLTDHAGKKYDTFLNTTVMSVALSVLARNAAQAPVESA